MAIQYQMEADKVREMLGEQNMRYLESDVKMRNAIQFLYDNAVITEPAEEAEEKSEEAAE
jgi:trigger factor